MRKLTVTILIIALLSGVYLPCRAADASVIVNGGFAEGTVGWSTVNAELSAVDDGGGNLCGKVEMKQAYGRAMNKYKFIKNVTYIVSVYVRLPKGRNTANLVIDHRSFGDKTMILSVAKDVKVSTEWAKLTGMYTWSGEGTGEAYIYVRVGGALEPMTYYIDNLTVSCYGDKPAAYSDTVVSENELAVNTGFENGLEGYELSGTAASVTEGGAHNTAAAARVRVISSPGRIGQKISFEQNTSYEFSAFVKSEKGIVEFEALVTLFNRQESGQSYVRDYSTESSAGEITVQIGHIQTSGTGWSRINGLYLHRGEACTGAVSLQCLSKDQSTFLLDDFSVVKKGKTETEITESPGIYINGAYTDGIQSLSFENGTAVYPVKSAAEILGAQLTKESEAVYCLSRGFNRLVLNGGNKTAAVNGKLIPISSIYFSGNEMKADLSALCRAFGAEAEIFENEKIVKITTGTRDTALANLSRRLSRDKEANIAFVGSAAACGMGAGLRNKTSYRALVMNWLKNKFSDCTFNEIHGTAGQADSRLALHCIDNVISQNPDVIFVDFCPEDSRTEYGGSVKYPESLVYKIRKECPKTDIVFLIGYSGGFAEDYGAQKTPETVKAYDSAAKKYKIPVIDISKCLYDKITENNEKESSYMLYLWYPNDAGHEFYAKCICDFIENAVDMPAEPEIIQVRPADGLVEGTVIDISEAVLNGFEIQSGSLAGTIGGELTLEFEGSSIGVLWETGIDTGAVDVEVDGTKYDTVFAFDEFGVRSKKQNYAIFDDSLKYGRHTLKLKVSDKKADMSLGHKISINGFLTERPAQ